MKTFDTMPRITIVLLVFLSIGVFSSGCQSNMTVKRMQAKNPIAKNSPKTPTKMVDVWKTYAQTTPEGKIMRGIAGRVHFYNDSTKKQAVKVDGDLTVFVFDGEEKDPAHAKPMVVYKFKADALPKHYAHKKPLGHGYDFFLPLDELGGEEKKICVMARFDDRLDEGYILAQPVNTVLEGVRKKISTPENDFQEYLAKSTILNKANREMLQNKETLSAEDPGRIRQVSFDGPLPDKNPEGKAPEKRSIETISLNDRMARSLSQAQVTQWEEPSEPQSLSSLK